MKNGQNGTVGGTGRGGVPKGPNDETSFCHLCPRLEDVSVTRLEPQVFLLFLLFLFIISLEIIKFFYIKIYSNLVQWYIVLYHVT